MAANWTLKENSAGELAVTVEGDAWKEACKKAFSKLAENVQVEGFRKGHVPQQLLEKRLPQPQVQIQAIDDNANDWLQDALKETGLRPVSRPTLDVKNMDSEKAELVFEFTVEPEFELGQYKDLDFNVEDVTVSDEEFDAEINRLRDQYADITVKDGAAEMGDTVNIDYKGFKDDVPFEGGEATGFNLELGSNTFIPGFEDQLIGCKAGDEKDLHVTFPEDYHAEELKGAPVVFKVKVNEVKQKVLPEVNDDFAKDVNAPGVENAEQLKDLIRNRIEEGKKMEAENKAMQDLAKSLADNTNIEIPEVMIKNEANNMVIDISQRIQQYGMKMEQYLQMMGQTIEELAKGFEEEAKQNVKMRLILDKIAKVEELVPSEEEIKAEFENLAAMYRMDVDQLKAQIDEELVAEDLRRQKAYEFVKEHVKKAKEKE